MDAIEALIGRASAPKLTGPGPTAEQMAVILKAGSRAPDHGRMQPFRFLIFEGDARDQLGDLMAASLGRREPATTDSVLDNERSKPLRAPVVVAVAAEVRPNPKVPDIEQVIAAGAAAQNMLLAAHALGLGGFWRTGAASHDREVKVALGFAPSDVIVGFLYFGSPISPAPDRPVDVESLTRRWASERTPNATIG